MEKLTVTNLTRWGSPVVVVVVTTVIDFTIQEHALLTVAAGRLELRKGG